MLDPSAIKLWEYILEMLRAMRLAYAALQKHGLKVMTSKALQEKAVVLTFQKWVS